MRFQTSTNVPVPAAQVSAEISPLAAAFRMVDTSEETLVKVQHLSESTESGQSQIIIPGSSRSLRVNLLQLVISWVNVTQPGIIDVKGPDTPPISVYQSLGGGNIVIPCFGEELFLGRYGLRATNNGIGGEYVVTAHYRLKEY